MFTKLKLTNIELGEVKIGGVEIELEHSVSEMRGTYELTKEVLSDLPSIIGDMKNAYLEINRATEDVEEDELRNLKRNIERKERRKEIIKKTLASVRNNKEVR